MTPSTPRRRGPGQLRALVATRRTLEAVAAALAIVALIETIVWVAGRNVSPQELIALCLLVLCATLPLALLRPAGAALAMTGAVVVALTAFRVGSVAGSLALLLALYLLGRGASRRQTQAVAVLLPLPFLVLVLFGSRPGASEAGLLAAALAAFAPAAAWGGIAEQALRLAAENSAAHEVIASTLLEHTARGERARIARELHDVVAHHISMVAVQAEAARVATPGMPAAGAQRLLAIGDTARAALTEMRRLLGVLRTDPGTDGQARYPADRHPQPGLAQLTDLVDQAREASGSATRLVLTGTPVNLDPGVELAAYRITQEALTNARRHAPGAAVDVELTFGPGTLCLCIRDNGPGPAEAPRETQGATLGGQGLPGMRERAAAVGGDLRIGAAIGGGFLVEAILPAGPAPEPAPGLEGTPVPALNTMPVTQAGGS
ncbi:MAG: sensor histidine kinase [Acidimicrobiales bacterium]